MAKTALWRLQKNTEVLFASEKYQLLSPFPVTTGISADRKHGDREDGVMVAWQDPEWIFLDHLSMTGVIF